MDDRRACFPISNCYTIPLVCVAPRSRRLRVALIIEVRNVSCPSNWRHHHSITHLFARACATVPQGFARMAVKHGYTVVPFASFGLEDAVSIAFGVDVSWIARTAEPDRGPLYIPFLLPYNSLQRQVRAGE